MNTDILETPELRDYLNIHHFLEDLYNVRKNNEPGFSYEAWAAELGVKSRSFLRLIVTGRRPLTDKMANKLAAHLCLEGADLEYFETLIRYSNSKNQQTRNFYGKQLMQLAKSSFEQKEIEHYYDLVANTLHPKILTLLTFNDIRKDSTSIASFLGVEIHEVEMGLKALQKLNLVQLNETNQEWEASQQQVKIPDAIGDVALLDYHAQSLQEAIAAQMLPKSERRYKALLLPFNQNEFSEFLEDLQGFVKKTMQKFDTDTLKDRKLHQINFNAYSVSSARETEK